RLGAARGGGGRPAGILAAVVTTAGGGDQAQAEGDREQATLCFPQGILASVGRGRPPFGRPRQGFSGVRAADGPAARRPCPAGAQFSAGRTRASCATPGWTASRRR